MFIVIPPHCYSAEALVAEVAESVEAHFEGRDIPRSSWSLAQTEAVLHDTRVLHEDLGAEITKLEAQCEDLRVHPRAA